jgi:hypothetical protein
VLNTFCFGYSVGYKFIQSETGVCNGNFLGIGADACHTAVHVMQSAPYGILITNGQFVAFRGEDPTMIVVDADHRGSVRFVNCSFWGPCHQIARIAGQGTVGLSDCTCCFWDARQEGRSAIQASGGVVVVRGCEFQQPKSCILLEPSVRGGVVSGNIFRGDNPVTDRTGGLVQMGSNVNLDRRPMPGAPRMGDFKTPPERAKGSGR